MILNKSDENTADKCAELLKNDEVVILPTDTVYGFSGIIGKSAEKIRKIKGREETKPFIQLIACPEDISKISDQKIPSKLLSYWPGPLTVIVKAKNSEETVAVRCPGDKWLRDVIKKSGKPIYSTSVNRSGKPVLVKIEEIRREFEKEVALIVDAGDSASSVPSTIVKLEGEGYSVLRQGAVVID